MAYKTAEAFSHTTSWEPRLRFRGRTSFYVRNSGLRDVVIMNIITTLWIFGECVKVQLVHSRWPVTSMFPSFSISASISKASGPWSILLDNNIWANERSIDVQQQIKCSYLSLKSPTLSTENESNTQDSELQCVSAPRCRESVTVLKDLIAFGLRQVLKGDWH